MARSRVLSFMSTFGGPQKRSSGSNSPVQQSPQSQPNYIANPAFSPTGPSANVTSPVSEEPPSRAPGRQRADSRPMSMATGYVGPMMDTNDTVPELIPIFNCLNSHQNKLYQEGYFLKLNDLDSQGRPYHDRSWTECFAQLVGTVLSLWDAAALDNAGSDGEVPATFINLGDASIKMIETLETRSKDAQPLQNVLSISTAGKNRYLLHFSNVNALTQWTAGIRLAMFEHSSLQETYTGALIGGKGKSLNSIRQIMTYSKFETSDWVRVRFGAGTPWRRCWCVICPPDEKEIAKAQKTMKKRSTYDRAQIILKGHVKFYESKTIKKKTQPVATITNAYAAYAIYPQSKPLIEQSTLIKIEGNVIIHTTPETRLESFIFVMPESHQAVTGFEMLLRFIFPIWDVFALYGRPQRLIPDTWNPKSLMFAMPKHDRWGYLDILDVTTLVTRPGSSNWSEAEWRKELKKLTAERIEKLARDPGRNSTSRPGSHHGHAHRNSLPSRTAALKFADAGGEQTRTSFGQDREGSNNMRSNNNISPPAGSPYTSPSKGHGRSVSESVPTSPIRRPQDEYHPSRLSKEAARPSYSSDDEVPPLPPAHGPPVAVLMHRDSVESRADSSDDERFHNPAEAPVIARTPADIPAANPVQPVAPPPAFSHQPGAKPQTRPYQSPELRRANSRMSSATLSQLHAAAGKQQALPNNNLNGGGDQLYGTTNAAYNRPHLTADHYSNNSGALGNNSVSSGYSSDVSSSDSSNLRAPGKHIPRSVSPLHQVTTVTPGERAQDKDSYFLNNPNGQQSNNQSSGSLPQPLALAPSDNNRLGRPPLQQNHSYSSQRQQLTPSPDKGRGTRPTSTGTINRKPVPPSPSRNPPEYMAEQQTSPTDEIRNRDVNEALVHRMDTIHSKASTLSRQYSGEGSEYESDPEGPPLVPDLAARDMDRQRIGNLKVVGDAGVQLEESWHPRDQVAHPAITLPDIDFGPTPSYEPELTPRPPTHQRLNSSSPVRGSQSPSRMDGANSRSSNRSGARGSEASHSRDTSYEDAQSFVWRPPSAAANHGTVTPDQFVNQKAAANRVPVYAHARQPSSPRSKSQHRPVSRTPPLVSRNSSADMSSANFFNPSQPDLRSPPDYSRYLSAREQENIARATGSTLVNIERKPLSPSGTAGLVAAIEAREEEKKAAKEGYNGHMAQQVIAKRLSSLPQNAGQQFYDMNQQRQVPGQFANTDPYAVPTWDQLQQQRNPQQAYSGYAYGRQTPQDYRQPNSNAYQQAQGYSQNGGYGGQGHQPYRG